MGGYVLSAMGLRSPLPPLPPEEEWLHGCSPVGGGDSTPWGAKPYRIALRPPHGCPLVYGVKRALESFETLFGDGGANEPPRRIADVVASHEPFGASDDIRLAVDDRLAVDVWFALVLLSQASAGGRGRRGHGKPSGTGACASSLARPGAVAGVVRARGRAVSCTECTPCVGLRPRPALRLCAGSSRSSMPRSPPGRRAHPQARRAFSPGRGS